MHQPLDLPVFLAQLGGEQVTYTVAPPVLLNLLLLRPGLLENADLSHIRNIGSGSAPLSPWMVRAVAGASRHPHPQLLRRQRGHGAGQRPGRHPRPGGARALLPAPGRAGPRRGRTASADMIETKLLDPETREVVTEPDAPGELAIRGATVFSGYWKRPGLTEDVVRRRGLLPDRRPVRHRRRGRRPLPVRRPPQEPHHPRRDEHRAGGDRVPAGRPPGDRRRSPSSACPTGASSARRSSRPSWCPRRARRSS